MSILLDRNGDTIIERNTPEFVPIKIIITLKDEVELRTFIDAIGVWDTEIRDTLIKEQK